MRDVNIRTFVDVADAIEWIENNLYQMHDFYNDIKAELLYVNGQWRASVITDTAQGELFD